MRLHLARRVALVSIAVVSSVLVFACCRPNHQPLTVDDINWDEPDQPAAITLSDPQIYSRETLVNDRRQEARYLQDLLKKSETAIFEPQIRRDLRTLTSTVLQLQAAYDPLSGRDAARAEELAEIENRVAQTRELTKLAEARIGLIEAQRRLEELTEEQEELSRIAAAETDDEGSDGTGDGGNDGGGGGEDDNGGDDSGGGDDNGGNGDEQTSNQEELDQKAKILRADVDALSELIAQLPSTAEVRQTAVGATPREVFRDRQAYRGELRGALAEVELDDAHDQGQNSLYRLQFRATVLPGKHQDKMGVARLTLKPPELKEHHVLELYKTWLGHVTYRLNQAAGDELRHDMSYLLLGMGLQRSLFHSITLELPNGESLYIALPPTSYDRWKHVTGGGTDLTELAEALEKRIKGCWKSRLLPEDDCHDLLDNLSRIEPFMSASIRGLSDIDSLGSRTAQEIRQLMIDFAKASETLDRQRRQREVSDHTLGSCLTKQLCAVPDTFLRTLIDCQHPCGRCHSHERVCQLGLCAGAESDEKLGEARGGADVYATAPVELAQQVSTTMSAFRSFETALSLAAALPTQGLGGNLGFNRLRAARSDIEARERLPQVVGFAEREIGDGEYPQFGWIFGPQAMIDAKESRLRLRRPVVNLPVTADLSIPGWWPLVQLQLETSWVGNWHSGTILPPAENTAPTFRVYLPLNRADLDGLTEYLAKKTVGGALAYTSIAAVSPDRITTCADKVTFLVYGANLWRSSLAYLNGLEASEIRVLPDMGGVSVTFDGIRDGMPQIPGRNGEARLIIWTRNGASSRTVEVLDPKTAGISCGPAKPQGLKLAVGRRPLIGVEGKSTASAEVRVVQGDLSSSYSKLGISIRPASPLAGGEMARWSPLPDKSAVSEEDRVEGSVEWKSWENLTLETGDELQVSLVEIPAPDAGERRHSVEGPLVFYSTQRESQIQVETQRIESLGDPVELVLPYRYDLAYPDLEGGKVTFGLEVGGGSSAPYEISIENPTPVKLPPAKGRRRDERRFSLRLKVLKGDQKLGDGDEAELLKKGLTLTLTVAPKDGKKDAALPMIKGEVKLGEGSG